LVGYSYIIALLARIHIESKSLAGNWRT